MFATICTQLFGFVIVFFIEIAVMIYGWGLEPKSWGWIIAGGVVVRFLVELMMVAARELQKKPKGS